MTDYCQTNMKRLKGITCLDIYMQERDTLGKHLSVETNHEHKRVYL